MPATAPPPPDTPHPDAERLCNHLADRIEANGSKRPPITKKWLDSARLMLDHDKRTEEQVIAAIDWCQDHEFWRSNILSMPKLREKYEQLRLQASRTPNRRHTRQAETDELFDDALIRARQRDTQEAQNDERGNGAAHPLRQSLLPPAGDRQIHPRRLA
jgi:hypothetical protein